MTRNRNIPGWSPAGDLCCVSHPLCFLSASTLSNKKATTPKTNSKTNGFLKIHILFQVIGRLINLLRKITSPAWVFKWFVYRQIVKAVKMGSEVWTLVLTGLSAGCDKWKNSSPQGKAEIKYLLGWQFFWTTQRRDKRSIVCDWAPSLSVPRWASAVLLRFSGSYAPLPLSEDVFFVFLIWLSHNIVVGVSIWEAEVQARDYPLHSCHCSASSSCLSHTLK